MLWKRLSLKLIPSSFNALSDQPDPSCRRDSKTMYFSVSQWATIDGFLKLIIPPMSTYPDALTINTNLPRRSHKTPPDGRKKTTYKDDHCLNERDQQTKTDGESTCTDGGNSQPYQTLPSQQPYQTLSQNTFTDGGNSQPNQTLLSQQPYQTLSQNTFTDGGNSQPNQTLLSQQPYQTLLSQNPTRRSRKTQKDGWKMKTYKDDSKITVETEAKMRLSKTKNNEHKLEHLGRSKNNASSVWEGHS